MHPEHGKLGRALGIPSRAGRRRGADGGPRTAGRASGINFLIEATVQSEAFRAFIGNESHAALRLLTTKAPTRIVSSPGSPNCSTRSRPERIGDADSGLVAYTIVRVIEGFVYNDTAAAVDPA